MKKIVACIFAALLSACGGGGSSTSPGATPVPTPPPTPNTPATADDRCLTLSPNPLSLALTQGSPAAVQVQATANCNFPDIINVAVVDKNGAFSANISLTAASQYSYTARLQTLPSLAAGSYDGMLEIHLCKDDPKICSRPHSGSPWHLPYHIQVKQAAAPIIWSIQEPPAIVANSNSTQASLTTQTAVGLSGAGPAQWYATTTAPWLKLVRSAGITNSSSLQFAVDPIEFAKLPNFADHKAIVTISANATDAPSTTTTVTLKKNIAELNYAGPYTMQPGQSAQIRLRGRGLASLNDLGQALQVNGISISNPRLISDTEITVQASSAGIAGTARFAIANAMGLDTDSAILKIVAPTSYGYQAFASEGYKGTLRFDVERQALLLVNRGDQKVLRYAYTGGSWLQSNINIAGADDAALSPDGKSLLVTSTSGLLSLLDPATLALQASYQGGPYAIGTYVSPRLAMLNDGRALFPQGNQWNIMATFDVRTRQFGHLGGSYYSGPWFSLSGDGERLVMSQSASVSPMPPMQYFDAANSVIRDVPDPDLYFFSTSSQNRDGSRIILDDRELRDNTFKLLGKFAPPSGPYALSYAYGSALASDSMRSYVMYLGPSTDPTLKPRIYVFDTSKAVSGVFPVLGYFEVPDSPTSCLPDAYCDPRMSTVVSPDGKTLFFAGNKNVLVIPVPSVLQH
ncbi:YncE family protein [Rugamonas rivuli]|uniref:IPT/TIG domain-containing protein n=1 Tax=Rugamonas rivuli TaxID=2743358 RepID=A0A843S9B7_9BURK|nr:hypothetical protein [Rugamonas rivuli]MQA18821.1 hypothetical protein [Rugamonas rivuli]